MNTTKVKKQAIRQFMQNHYTDERLAQLLAHARDGKLAFHSCCCFIGVATADHALKEHDPDPIAVYALTTRHYLKAGLLPGASEAELAFKTLSNLPEERGDPRRRRILIPMIRAEMKRREWARMREEVLKEVAWA